jgi:hypothetical protein
MLNGLQVDFNKTQKLIYKEITPHVICLRADSLKTYGLIYKSCTSSQILTTRSEN